MRPDTFALLCSIMCAKLDSVWAIAEFLGEFDRDRSHLTRMRQCFCQFRSSQEEIIKILLFVKETPTYELYEDDDVSGRMPEPPPEEQEATPDGLPDVYLNASVVYEGSPSSQNLSLT